MPTPPVLLGGGVFMELVSESIISKEGEKKRHYLPLETRIQLYNEVHRLRKQGLSQRKIQKIVYEEYRIKISSMLISYWVRGKHNPLGNINKFNDKPSPELSYIIGVISGDGYKYFDGKGYLLRLAVNDKEFAEAFARNLTKILRKDKPYKIFWNGRSKQWIVVGCSIQLFKFLEEKSLEELKPYIEYNKDCVSSFLKALFDGEGSIYPQKCGWTLELYNTDKRLLIYVKYLLGKYFEIDSTGPHLARKTGKIVHSPNGEYKATKNYYYLYIRRRSLINFHKFIGFSIKRKQRRLLKAIKR